jgi:hypothetical protein
MLTRRLLIRLPRLSSPSRGHRSNASKEADMEEMHRTHKEANWGWMNAILRWLHHNAEDRIRMERRLVNR